VVDASSGTPLIHILEASQGPRNEPDNTQATCPPQGPKEPRKSFDVFGVSRQPGCVLDSQTVGE